MVVLSNGSGMGVPLVVAMVVFVVMALALTLVVVVYDILWAGLLPTPSSRVCLCL